MTLYRRTLDRRTLDRRTLMTALAILPATARAAPPRVAALFAGLVDDGGFMQAGYEGLEQARAKLGVTTGFVQNVRPVTDELAAALRSLAAGSPDLVVAHGGQNSAAARLVAAEFPDVRFVVTQGDATGANLASYEVLQEQSAYLAGTLAALTTRTGVVGHMSGIRVTPGLKGRAAFVAGALAARPDVRVLTNFSGSQDDPALARRVALAMIDAGADILFTMLNAGRSGAIDACAERGVTQIGNVRDWTRDRPDVFVASAVAESGQALFDAVSDLVAGRFTGGVVRHIGLEDPSAVRLALRPGVPEPVRDAIDRTAAGIVAGTRAVPVAWSGPEFATPG